MYLPTKAEKNQPLVRSCHLAFPQGFLQNPSTIRIPFRMTGRLITVEAQIEDQIGNFIIDTGADKLLLNSNYFKPDRVLNHEVAYGSTGEIGKVLLRHVDTLKWDNLFFLKVKANVIDMRHIERKKNARILGLIGYEVFKDFEIFFDFQFNQIVLTKLDSKGNRLDGEAIWEVPYDSLNFRLKGHVIILNGKVKKERLKFTLDSGAELNLLDRGVRRKVLKNFKITKRARLLGAGQKEIEVLAGKLYDVNLENIPCPGMRTLLTNLDALNYSFGTQLDGVLGFEFLIGRRILINYKKKKLYFFNLQKP